MQMGCIQTIEPSRDMGGGRGGGQKMGKERMFTGWVEGHIKVEGSMRSALADRGCWQESLFQLTLISCP